MIDYLQDRVVADKVEEMTDRKIGVLFYDWELTNIKVNTRGISSYL